MGADHDPAHRGPPDATPEEAETTSALAFEAGKSVAEHSWLLYVGGGACVVAGIAAIALPVIASLAAAVAFGACLLFSGSVGVFAAFRGRDHWQIASAFGLSLLAILAGGLMLVQPVAGIFALTTLIAAWLAAGGVLRTFYGFRRRHERGAGWMIASGILSITVALLVWFGLPFNAVWVPGVVLGLDLIIWGVLLIALAIYSKSPPSVLTTS